MHRLNSRRALRRMAVLALLVAGLIIPPAFVATPSASAETFRDRYTVDFTIPSGACADLPDGIESVSGTAHFFVVTTVRVDKSGVTHINQNQIAFGTATDNEGGFYLFNYANHASYTVPAGADFPQQVRMSDHFNLNGKGRAAHMHVGFVIVGTIEGPDDPFPFHTDAISVRGDAFNCDPI